MTPNNVAALAEEVKRLACKMAETWSEYNQPHQSNARFWDEYQTALKSMCAAIDALAACAAQREVEKLPKNPPLGLLMSMAIREDHGLGMPGFYDQPMYSIGMSHQRRVEGAISRMRQLYEEASGNGFYRPELEEHYAAMATPKEGA